MKLISLGEARQSGLKHYFTGKPCKRGHIADRVVYSRQCSLCQKQYSESYYELNKAKYKARSDKRYTEKKAHVLSVQKSYNERNQNKVRELHKKYSQSDAGRAAYKRHYEKHREAVLAKCRKHYLENAEKVAAKVALRRARKRMATPPWFGELDELVWVEAADLVQLRRVATGIEWHADHMIPIGGRKAKGLHVWNNCQVITRAMNLSKNNKMVLTEPLEWLQHL